MRKKAELDSFEKGIEAQSSGYFAITGSKCARIEAILKKSRKTRHIDTRISEYNLARLKQRSRKKGIPYHILISRVPHKFVSGRMVDEKEIL